MNTGAFELFSQSAGWAEKAMVYFMLRSNHSWSADLTIAYLCQEGQGDSCAGRSFVMMQLKNPKEGKHQDSEEGESKEGWRWQRLSLRKRGSSALP